jgi:hypothetical protein
MIEDEEKEKEKENKEIERKIPNEKGELTDKTGVNDDNEHKPRTKEQLTI